jgi:hypothetical protein
MANKKGVIRFDVFNLLPPPAGGTSLQREAFERLPLALLQPPLSAAPSGGSHIGAGEGGGRSKCHRLLKEWITGKKARFFAGSPGCPAYLFI